MLPGLSYQVHIILPKMLLVIAPTVRVLLYKNPIVLAKHSIWVISVSCVQFVTKLQLNMYSNLKFSWNLLWSETGGRVEGQSCETSRVVWGHAPPEKLCFLEAQNCYLQQESTFIHWQPITREIVSNYITLWALKYFHDHANHASITTVLYYILITVSFYSFIHAQWNEGIMVSGAFRVSR